MNSEPLRSSKGRFIFVVEDSKDLRDLIKTLYEMEGYQVEFAADGRQALERLRKLDQPPSVILLDLMMPGMDGYQFRAEQEKDARLAKIPVLVMTADAGAEFKARQVGAQGFLRKPVDADSFIKVAEKFCS